MTATKLLASAVLALLLFGCRQPQQPEPPANPPAPQTSASTHGTS